VLPPCVLASAVRGRHVVVQVVGQVSLVFRLDQGIDCAARNLANSLLVGQIR